MRGSSVSGKASRLAAFSWILYDFSNTIFSVTVLSFFFPLWVEERVGSGGFLSGAGLVNSATAVSALLVVLTAPVLGAIADLRQRRVPYLILLTIIAVALTAALDVAGGVVVGLALFVSADLAYQSALVFYNALFPVVSAGRGAGRISGYGTAVGYVGTILGLVVLTYFVENGETVRPLLGPLGGWLETRDEVYSNAFVPTAVIYLVFSLPAFFFVPDPAVRARRPVALGMVYREVVRTVKNLRAYAGVGTFILATVLYTDAANTAIANMALYGRVVFEMDGTQVRNLLLFSTVFAVVGSAVFGLLTDRVGPRRSLVGVLVLWLVAIVLSAAALGAWMLFLAGPIVGIALGGMWTVGRVLLVIFGGGAYGYRISIGSLAIIMALGLFFLLRVPDARPERNVDEFAPKTGTPLDSPAPRAEDVRHEGEGQSEGNSMRLVALRGQIVTDYEVWPDGTVLLGGGSITNMSTDDSLVAEPDEVHDHPESLILPGFVDLQVNGAFGVDVASESARLPELSEALLSTGTTSYLPTVISSPESLYEDVLPAIGTSTGSGAEVLGVHLEGPFISVQKKGAHAAAHIVMPDAELLAHLLDLGPVRMITLAPELEDADRLISLAVNRGVVVSAGHSDVAFEPAYDALDGHVAGVTHLFNAMSAMHHREPGLPGAAFAHPRAVCSLISDGLHVHPEMVGLAFRMLGPDRLCLVTDAIAATGMEDGEYRLATRTVYGDDGIPRLGSGSIAGSMLTMREAFMNILAFTGCTVPEAARMTSTSPARLVGEGRRKGRLVPGYDADVTVLTPDLSVESVWRGGKLAYSWGGG